MSVIQFGCPFCGAVAEVDAELAGQEAACPACECLLLVPQPEGPVVDASGSAATAQSPAARKKNTSGTRASKPKLWQTSAKTETSADVPNSTSDRNERPPDEEPIDVHEVLGEVSDSPLGGSGQGLRYGSRASEIVRAQQARRRFWVNAAMLVVSMAVLCGALLLLMQLTRR